MSKKGITAESEEHIVHDNMHAYIDIRTDQQTYIVGKLVTMETLPSAQASTATPPGLGSFNCPGGI